MESKKAYLQLLEISKDQKFEVLVDYLSKSDPVNLKTSTLSFVPYLASVVAVSYTHLRAHET